MLAEQMAGLIASAPLHTLDDLSRDVWKGMATGMLTDDQAHGLAEGIHARRVKARSGAQPLSAGSKRSWSYFPPKRPQRSPDRERSLYRRRQLAASGPIPPTLACRFTTGELAVLRIVADTVRRWGVCGLSIPEIAAKAGVGQTKARMAIREAERLGLLTIQERRQHCRPNLPNLVRIINRDWLSWIAKSKGAPRAVRTREGGFTFPKATDRKDSGKRDTDPIWPENPIGSPYRGLGSKTNISHYFIEDRRQ